MTTTTLEPLRIRSHKHVYSVNFCDQPVETLRGLEEARRFFVVDQNVYRAHPNLLRACEPERTHVVEASEASKSLPELGRHVDALLGLGIRRGDRLVSIGGGVIQDLTSFVASTLFRGLDWECVPTTLLAQADSCIGSKTSLNLASMKNALGTFHPPRCITISPGFLESLTETDLRSGIGEMLKVHILEGPQSFERAASAQNDWLRDPVARAQAIRASLEIKRPFCEEDEFDRGPRLLLNYGHSFGHAIELASDFAVPHGIAVTLGMDLANWVALRLGRIDLDQFAGLSVPLRQNAGSFRSIALDFARFWDALRRDKKNQANAVVLILLSHELRAERVSLSHDSGLRDWCADYWSGDAA